LPVTHYEAKRENRSTSLRGNHYATNPPTKIPASVADNFRILCTMEIAAEDKFAKTPPWGVGQAGPLIHPKRILDPSRCAPFIALFAMSGSSATAVPELL
jgi:hypothetical protein